MENSGSKRSFRSCFPPMHDTQCCVPTFSNRNLSWTYYTVYTDQIHRMSKGIFCMSKNLTEVIENIDKEERKEFWSVTLYKGKLAVLMFTFINILFAISCYVLAQKSRW